MQSLWGEEFNIQDTKEKINKVLTKIKTVEEMDDDEFKKYVKSKKVSMEDKLDAITRYVRKVLKEHISTTQVIKSYDELVAYFDTIEKDCIVAYDTETNKSLDPYTGRIIGLCLYSPNNKPAYVPINHKDYKTNERLSWQVSEEQCNEQLQRLRKKGIKIIMHNGGFDYKFTKKSLGVELPIYWDTMIAARIINENDISAGLKWQYHYKVDPNHPIYDIESLFPDIPYEYIDPFVFALYSATDSLMTYKLFLYQFNILTQDSEKGAYRLFTDVEMPLVIPVAEMELDGVKFDMEYSERLKNKYTNLLNEYDSKLNSLLDEIKPKIDEWRKTDDANERPKIYGKGNEPTKTYPLKDKQGIYKLGKSKNETLEVDMNLESPAQLSILLYDILKYQPLDNENPRSTDKFALDSYAKNGSELCKTILDRRQVLTLLDDFILKLPKLVNPVTGKIHCNFNQLGKEDKGVVTGRFSSSDPNLQQIPSKNSEIRLLFCGDIIYNDSKYTNFEYKLDKLSEVLVNNEWKYSVNLLVNDVLTNDDEQSIITDILIDDYVRIKVNKPFSVPLKSKIEYILCGSDYSAQEPRLTANYSQDDVMLKAYEDKKDLYSVIAQSMYENKYEDNLEFYPEGTKINIDGEDIICGYKTHKNKAGKKRRSEAKTVLLGMLYGRGAYSIAEQVGRPKEDGQKIIDNFFKSFPKVKAWIDATHEKVRRLGYVEDWYGRRRHLPEVNLPLYSLDYTEDYKKKHNTFNPILECQDRIDDQLKKKYSMKLNDIKGKRQLENLQREALSEGLKITSNEGFIAKAERQSVNAIVQGGAATLTKLAMINIYNDEELNKLGLRMLIPIHDEILCTCPKINGEKASERLVQVMVDTAKPYMNVPMSCDPYLVSHWYWDELSVQIQNEFEHLQEEMTREEALKELKKIHCELLEKDLLDMLERKE